MRIVLTACAILTLAALFVVRGEPQPGLDGGFAGEGAALCRAVVDTVRSYPLPVRCLFVVLLFVTLSLSGILLSPSFLKERALGRRSRIVSLLGVLSWSVLAASAFLIARLCLMNWARAGTLGPLRVICASLFHLLVFSSLFLSTASRMTLRRTGSFLNMETMRFFVLNFRPTLRCFTGADWRALLSCVSLSLAQFAILMMLTAAETGASGSRGELAFQADALFVGSSIIFLLCIVLYPLLRAGEDGEEHFRLVARRSTPGLALLSSALPRHFSRGPLPLQGEPVRGMDAYLAGVDSARLRRPDVILIVVESLRRDSLTALGAGRVLMPFLEGLAGESLVFSGAYAQSNCTNYSTTSLLSSLYPLKAETADRFERLDYPRTLIYDLLEPLGYRSGIFSSQNENWGNMRRYLASASLDTFFHSEDYEGETLIPREDTGVWKAVRAGLLRTGQLDDRLTVKRFLEWADAGPEDRPIFAYVNLQVAHFPYEQAFDVEAIHRPNELDFDASFLFYPPEKRAVMRNRYWNSLRHADRRIEDIVGAFRRRGSDAVFVIVGDHGEEFYEQGGVTHARSMHEVTLRVPLIIHGPPGWIPRRVDGRPIQHIDVFPTLLGLLGLGPYPGFQGRDVLRAGAAASDHTLFLTTQCMKHQNALIWRGYKLIEDEEGPTRLYFVEGDPRERRDLSVDCPEIATTCRRVLRGWRARQIRYYADAEHRSRYYPPRYDA